MSDPTFLADPTRLIVAAVLGIALLLLLIIKCKLHPVISMMISAVFIGIGAGMPLNLIADTVEKGVGNTLKNIALLIGLGSMFGQILEESGGARQIAQTFINKFGQGHSSWALGITGLVIGTTVFFEAGVVVLIPLAFSVASQTKKSALYYGIALLAGLASGYAFVPPSAGSVLVAGTLGVDLGTMIAVGIPVAFIAMAVAGVYWGRFIGGKIDTPVPAHIMEAEASGDDSDLPSFGMVMAIVLTPLVLILLGTLSQYLPIPEQVAAAFAFLGKPFVALTISTLVAMYLLGTRRGYTGAQLKALLDRSLKPVGMILLVIACGGVIRWMLQDCGLGQIIGPLLEQSHMPMVLVGFLIALLVRASVGSSIVAMTMASGIMATMPAVMGASMLGRAAVCIAICGGATALSHVNDAGFWMCSSFLEIDEKTTLKSWTVMETLIGLSGLVCALIISFIA
ncbi:GntP family permease [Collinsella sp. UBA1693]|uniref:GntP family permease n=1 Tax=Collinsella sp. UBA1693 TaxID=1946385 RepID=UPI00257C758C|nr:gluconate:H+ symporter [Collinsella sp. UBA1693]